ncbi:MAG: hypothetical protein IKU07_05285 [Oscillospiraceae bacterium]|nr:hypothetical protein [Oscillospiraceae bacterium]
MEEKLYFSPSEFPGSHSRAFQAAVDAAMEADVRVVAVHGTWHLTEPVQLPGGITVILDGAVVEADGTAFETVPAPRTLAGEQHKIFLLGGHHGGTLRSLGHAPLVRFSNCRDCRIADLTLEGGGLELDYFQYSKLQQLKILDAPHGVIFYEGCNNIIMENVLGESREEALLLRPGAAPVLGRDPGFFNSIFCRLGLQTGGAAAVRFAADIPIYNIVLRDITDETENGCTVILGKTEDVTVRGIAGRRDGVITTERCDGLFLSNLQCKGQPFLPQKENTRTYHEQETMPIVQPAFGAPKPDRLYVTPNETPGQTDGESIQNAVDLAAKTTGLVVIPRWNVARQQALWEVEKAVKVPSNVTVVFLCAYLRQADFCYENMFINSRAYEAEGRCLAHEEHNIAFIGIGDAVLDGGKPNGLLEKTCNLYGLPDKRKNATVLFNNVRNLVLENFQIRQSRWYCTYFIHCDTCRISNLDFDNWEDCCNRDGVDIRQGCHNFLVENITGTTGDDTVALNNLGNDGNDGRYVEGKDPDTLNMVIRNIKSDAGSWFTVRLLCQDRHLEQNFLLDTIMDVSLPENQKGVNATVVIGSHEYHYKVPAEVGDLAHLTIRDVYGRGRRVLGFGGCSDDVGASNIHGYGENHAAVSVFRQAKTRNVRIHGVFHKRTQQRRWGVEEACPKAEGVVLDLQSLETEKILVEHVFGDTARVGVCVTGKANAEIRDFHINKASDQIAICGSGCKATVNGETVPVTESLTL